MFGVYDIRGVWGRDLDFFSVAKLAKTFSTYLDDKEVGIGRDIRISSDPIFYILCNYMEKTILDYGIVSTPITHFGSVIYDVDSIMITASHNPPEYNGFKPIHKKAEDFQTEEILKLRDIFEGIRVLNKVTPDIDIRWEVAKSYFDHIYSAADFSCKLEIGFDAANGSGFVYYDYLKKIFDVHAINITPDGRFPSHSPDPSKEENLKDLLNLCRSKGVKYGIAVDGDCDRLGLVFNGRWMRSDEIIYYISKYCLKKGDKVVLEVMLPYILDELLEDLGIKVIRVPTGHVNVKRAARDNNAEFFGEYSGHFGFKEFYYIDDALYTFIKIVNLLESGIDLDYPNIFQTRFDVDKSRLNLEEFISKFDPLEVLTVDGYDMRLENGRVLVRESNTEPKYRIKIEALDKKSFEDLVSKVKFLIKK